MDNIIFCYIFLASLQNTVVVKRYTLINSKTDITRQPHLRDLTHIYDKPNRMGVQLKMNKCDFLTPILLPGACVKGN